MCCFSLILSAIADAVKHWQEVKVQGELEETNNEEEDIYADARLVEVMDTNSHVILCTMFDIKGTHVSVYAIAPCKYRNVTYIYNLVSAYTIVQT